MALEGGAIDLASEIRALLRQQGVPDHELERLDAGMDLLALPSLGLDSVRLAGLLLSCEARLGIRLPAEILTREPLTIEGLIVELRGALASSR